MASSRQRKELLEGDSGTLQEPSMTEPPFQHKNHESGKSRMVPALTLDEPHLAPGAGRESPKIQTNTQRPAPTRMELAKGKEQRRMECTILAHIDTGTSALNIQNKRHLHWKALDRIPGMNNEAEFFVVVHNLLMKTDAENST
jgi:hypothetical protein